MSTALMSAAVAEVALVTYRAAAQKKTEIRRPIANLPLPSEYASVIIVFGALNFLPDSAGNLPALVGWGLVLATALNLWNPNGTVKQADKKANQKAAAPAENPNPPIVTL